MREGREYSTIDSKVERVRNQLKNWGQKRTEGKECRVKRGGGEITNWKGGL